LLELSISPDGFVAGPDIGVDAPMGVTAQQDGDVLVFGSRTPWTDLLARGLVDELHRIIGPKIVARDHHAVAGTPETDLRLLDVRCWDDSDNVVLQYATAPAEYT
jgi:riboflavin biosynthesis pyrimidine reductase